MEKHIDVLGALWIAWGAIGCLIGMIFFGILFGVSFIPDMGHETPIILRSVGFGLGLFIFILSVPEIIAGIGLLKRLEWGRILALVMAFFSLLSIPLGTALGIYSIVILLREETAALFKSVAQKG